jgi:hypothetical protein
MRPADMRDARQDRTFALTLSGGFLFLGLLAELRHRDGAALVTFTLSAISLLAALIIPGRLEPVRRLWMKLGEAIGYVTTPIVMAIVYYLLVTPIGIATRLKTRRRPETDSSWHERPPLPEAKRMERQF